MPADPGASGWQTEPTWNDTGVQSKYRNFWRRFFAGVVDSLVFLPVSILDDAISKSSVPAVLIAWGAISYLSFQVYSIVMHGLFGATLGKMATGIVVLDVSESRVPGMKQAFMRDLPWAAFSALSYLYLVVLVLEGRYAPGAEMEGPGLALGLWATLWFLLELVTMLGSEKRRALHDLIGRTVVVKRSALPAEP